MDFNGLFPRRFNKDDFSYINIQTIEEKLHDIRVEYFNHKMYIFGINAEFKMRGLLFVAEDLIGSQEIRDQTKCGVGHAVVCYDEDRLLSIGGNSILNTNQRSVQLIRDSGVPDSFSTQVISRPNLTIRIQFCLCISFGIFPIDRRSSVPR